MRTEEGGDIEGVRRGERGGKGEGGKGERGKWGKGGKGKRGKGGGGKDVEGEEERRQGGEVGMGSWKLEVGSLFR